MGDFVPSRLALADRAAEQPEGFEEEASDEMGLEAACLGPLHLFANLPDRGDVHRVVGSARSSISSWRCS